MNDWMSFNALWKLNEPTLQLSNTAEQNKHIYEAIIQVSQESKVDARIILALIMQEVYIHYRSPSSYQDAALLTVFPSSQRAK